MQFTRSQLGTVLAALRYWQEAVECDEVPSHLYNIATDGDELPLMTADEIDELCEDINCAPSTTENPCLLQ